MKKLGICDQNKGGCCDVTSPPEKPALCHRCSDCAPVTSGARTENHPFRIKPNQRTNQPPGVGGLNIEHQPSLHAVGDLTGSGAHKETGFSFYFEKTVLQRIDHMIKGQETGTAVSPLWVRYTVIPVPFAVSADVTSISCRPSCSFCPPGLRCWCEADHHPEDNPLPDCSSVLEGPQTPPPPPHPVGNHFHPTPSGSL